MARHVERGEVPGIVTLVGGRGEVHVDSRRVGAALLLVRNRRPTGEASGER
jgi:hypothetical protein